MNFDSDYLILNRLHTKFLITYKKSNSGMPPGKKFDIKELKRPTRPTPEVKALVVSLDRDSIGIKYSSRNYSNTGGPDLITVMDTTSTNGCLIKTVETGCKQ